MNADLFSANLKTRDLIVQLDHNTHTLSQTAL